jgi:hypothetical protein
MVFTNGKVSLSTNLVFGPCVLGENGWFPINRLTADEARYVLRLIDHNPTCPEEFLHALHQQRSH